MVRSEPGQSRRSTGSCVTPAGVDVADERPDHPARHHARPGRSCARATLAALRMPGAGAIWEDVLVFVVALVVYSFHEFTEAGVLPRSEALHLATEPYGPDGTYGHHLISARGSAPGLAGGREARGRGAP